MHLIPTAVRSFGLWFLLFIYLMLDSFLVLSRKAIGLFQARLKFSSQ